MASLTAGCGKSAGPAGPPKHPVSGTVTIDGAPLASGKLLFVGNEGTQMTAVVEQEGRYQMAGGLPAGQYKVSVHPNLPPAPLGPIPEDYKKKAKESELPAKYADRKTSGLECEVKDGENTCDFKLSR
jgi:hypothetical protein